MDLLQPLNSSNDTLDVDPDGDSKDPFDILDNDLLSMNLSNAPLSPLSPPDTPPPLLGGMTLSPYEVRFLSILGKILKLYVTSIYTIL